MVCEGCGEHYWTKDNARLCEKCHEDPTRIRVIPRKRLMQDPWLAREYYHLAECCKESEA